MRNSGKSSSKIKLSNRCNLGEMGLRSFTDPVMKLPCARPPGTKNGLSVESLSCAFDRQTVFEGISFSAVPGEVLGIVGNNGAGKTTLTRCLCGLLKEEGIPTPGGKKVWGKAVVDHVTVYSRDDIRFTFKNGMEIKP